MLFVVATPIGNLKDITLRALDVLRGVDLVACEDKRRTGMLLKNYDIRKRLVSYHDHNKVKQTPKIISLLKAGKTVALVSDGGTPGISDPGFYLVRECIRNSIDVSPVPGPSAAVSAISCSGLPTDSFSFYGFLPKKEKKKTDFFNSIRDRKETVICYESPHRITGTLKLMTKVLPDKDVCLARELTKRHEEFIRGTPEEIMSRMTDGAVRGEIVLLIA